MTDPLPPDWELKRFKDHKYFQQFQHREFAETTSRDPRVSPDALWHEA
jgi:hypothetical protein